MIKITGANLIFLFIISCILVIVIEMLVGWIFYPHDTAKYTGAKLPELSIPAWYYNGQGKPFISSKGGVLVISGSTDEDQAEYLLDTKIDQKTGAYMQVTMRVITTNKFITPESWDKILTPLADVNFSLNALDSFGMVNIYSDGVMLVNNANDYEFVAFNTTDSFHIYRLELIKNFYTLYIDKKMVATIYDRSNSDGWTKFCGYKHSGHRSQSEWHDVSVSIKSNHD